MNRIFIECDGVLMYLAKPDMVSVHDGMATIAVKGSIPISVSVEKIEQLKVVEK